MKKNLMKDKVIEAGKEFAEEAESFFKREKEAIEDFYDEESDEYCDIVGTLSSDTGDLTPEFNWLSDYYEDTQQPEDFEETMDEVDEMKEEITDILNEVDPHIKFSFESNRAGFTEQNLYACVEKKDLKKVLKRK